MDPGHDDPVKECTVLFIHAGRPATDQVRFLRELGLVVDEACDWPEGDDHIRRYEVIIVRLPEGVDAPGIATRLRAKRNFGRRVLVAIVGRDLPLAQARAATSCGFDVVMKEDGEDRALAAQILRVLRQRPEFRCRIPRRRAA